MRHAAFLSPFLKIDEMVGSSIRAHPADVGDGFVWTESKQPRGRFDNHSV